MNFLILLASALTMAQPDPLPADIAWVASGEFCEPETVLPLPDNTLLISNVCGFGDPGNGFLSQLDGDGKVLDWRILEGLDAPLGMALHDQNLFVVDSNRVKVFTWPDYQLLETVTLDTRVANDIAVAADGTIYVSDTAGHQVVVISEGGEQSVLTGQQQFQGANGLHIVGRTLYVGGSRLWKVDLEELSISMIGPEWLTDIDGIEVETDGTLQITPVGGPLIRYRNNDSLEILAGEGVSSANHGYATNLGLALIPTGFDNTVVAIRVDENAAVPESFTREVLIDNPTVEVVRMVYPVGSESGMHSHEHPHRVAYVLEGGVLELVPADSEEPRRSLEIQAGQAIFLPAATHNVRNIGKTEIVIIETEIK